MLEFHKILVPVDFSELSQRALDQAIGLAVKFGAEIHLLHCCQLDPIAMAPYDIVLPASLDQTIQEAARGLLAEWARRAAGQGVKVHWHLSAGAAWAAIADMAESLGADLIVIGTRGLSGFKRVLLGSVAERTIQLARCPVLTVNHGAAIV
jgi:nucleotide-binding universal stress UspA family protein